MTGTNLPGFGLAMVRPTLLRHLFEAPNAPELFKEYAEECSLPETGEILPQAHLGEWQAFGGALPLGGATAFGVYDGEMLVGFATVFIYLDRAHGKMIATTQSIFLTAAYRNEGNALRLLEFLEKYAEKCGCSVFSYNAPAGSRFARLFSVQGRYRQSSTVFLRTLRGKGPEELAGSFAEFMRLGLAESRGTGAAVIESDAAGNAAVAEVDKVVRTAQEGLQDNGDIAIAGKEIKRDLAISDALLQLDRGEKPLVN